MRCVLAQRERVYMPSKLKPLLIKKERRNNRQMCLVDKYGCEEAKGPRMVHGFKTGDIVKAVSIEGKEKRCI